MELPLTIVTSRLRRFVRRAPADGFIALVRQLREDYWTHRSELMMPGFHTVVTHRIGNWLQHAPAPVRFALSPVYTVLFLWCRNVYGIELPRETVLGRRVRFPHQGGIVIHQNARIGDDCVIRQNVTIGAVNPQRSTQAATLGNGVELGAGAAIIGRVTVGDGARIGPNTVIMTNVPAGATVFAANARVIQMVRRPTIVADEQRNTA